MLRILISTVEALGLLIVLVLSAAFSANATFWVSLLILLLAIFTLLTGRCVPRIRSRWKALVIASVAGIGLIGSAGILHDQQQQALAELRETNPDAYLAEIRNLNQERWLLELQELRPEQYEAEAARRIQEAEADAARRLKDAEAERQRACTDRQTVMAYIMIQGDVRARLRAPATAEFPWRAGRGTRHMGDCVYRVFGHVDAQNAFGAMLRTNFQGNIEYFPDSGSWRTLELAVD